MKRWRVAVAIGALLLGMVTAFALIYVPTQRDLRASRANYERARADFEQTQEQQRQLERRLEALRTRVDSVELGARTEYRLVRPGERLEILAWRSAGLESGATP